MVCLLCDWQWQSTQSLKEKWCACTRDSRVEWRMYSSLQMGTCCSPAVGRLSSTEIIINSRLNSYRCKSVKKYLSSKKAVGYYEWGVGCTKHRRGWEPSERYGKHRRGWAWEGCAFPEGVWGIDPNIFEFNVQMYICVFFGAFGMLKRELVDQLLLYLHHIFIHFKMRCRYLYCMWSASSAHLLVAHFLFILQQASAL